MIEDNINGYIDVIDHPRVWNWLNDLAKREPFLFYALVRDNSIYLERFLGKPEKQTTSEWDKCWFYTYKGLQFKILSNENGTVFLCKTITTEEDFKNDFKLGIAVINFLEEILMKVSGTTC